MFDIVDRIFNRQLPYHDDNINYPLRQVIDFFEGLKINNFVKYKNFTNQKYQSDFSPYEIAEYQELKILNDNLVVKNSLDKEIEGTLLRLDLHKISKSNKEKIDNLECFSYFEEYTKTLVKETGYDLSAKNLDDKNFRNKKSIQFIRKIVFVSKRSIFANIEDGESYYINDDVLSIKKLRRIGRIHSLLKYKLAGHSYFFEEADYKQLNDQKCEIYQKGKYTKTEIIRQTRKGRFELSPEVSVETIGRSIYDNKVNSLKNK